MSVKPRRQAAADRIAHLRFHRSAHRVAGLLRGPARPLHRPHGVGAPKPVCGRRRRGWHTQPADAHVLDALRRLIALILKDGAYAFLLRIGWQWALGLVLAVVGLAVLAILLIGLLIAVLL